MNDCADAFAGDSAGCGDMLWRAVGQCHIDRSLCQSSAEPDGCDATEIECQERAVDTLSPCFASAHKEVRDCARTCDAL
jgi:hypothetical protein